MRFSNLAILCSVFLMGLPSSTRAQKGNATAQNHWVGTWAAAPFAREPEPNFLVKETTLRQIVHVSLGGSKVRIVFTNEFAARRDSLTIDGATIAATSGDGVINPASAKPLTFNGQTHVVIPAGALMFSDPVDLPISAFSNLAITMLLPPQHMVTFSQHHTAQQTSYFADGNQLDAAKLRDPQKTVHWFFLSGVDVLASPEAGAIATIGDSITDGSGSTPDTNRRWPDVLAQRLQANKKTANLAVINEGIGGGRLLHEGAGPSALARLDRDVLSKAGVRYLIVFEGINDINGLSHPDDSDNHFTTADFINALNQIIERAHSHGIKVFGGTITPFQESPAYTENGENFRQTINEFIRNGGEFDGVIDFDQMLRMPSNPHHIVDTYSGHDGHTDHMHPNDAGYKRMGEGIDLRMFER